MNRKPALLIIALAALLAAAGIRAYTLQPREVTVTQLATDPGKYSGKNIIVEAYIFHGWEVIVLCESLEPSGYAEDHIIPGGWRAWVEGGVPLEVYEQLHTQDMMGPEERYGKVRVQGRFQYGGEYGHIGGYEAQITIKTVELLQWTP